MKNDMLAFTLVEIIVVITILAILGTIGFISFRDYTLIVRDSARINDIKVVEKSLGLYRVTNSSLPLPDDMLILTVSGTTSAYQGNLGAGVLNEVRQAGKIVDPFSKDLYTFAVDSQRQSYQILAFMEKDKSQSFKSNMSNQKVYADNQERFLRVFSNTGDRGVILLSSENTPLQNIESGIFELKTNPYTLKLVFSTNEVPTASGYSAGAMASTRLGTPAPIDCPVGFIGVPGNPEFSTEGFCVAQYEMTYADVNSPNSPNHVMSFNTIGYVPNKTIVSQAGKYPITNITQQEAINACKSMGEGYHLITNNEWMTIARNIEANKKNWSGGAVGAGNIYIGVSNNTGLGCDITGGNIEIRTYATKTGPGNVSCNPLRSHKITQGGGVIWDFSGNVWEHVNKANTLDGSGYNTGQSSVSDSSRMDGWDDDGVYSTTDMIKYGAATGGGTVRGMGNLYYAQGVSSNIFVRGGLSNHGIDSGIFLLYLFHSTNHRAPNLGFRCAK